MVISPEHPLVEKWADKLKNIDEVRAYQQEAAHKSDFERTELNKDKTGVKLDGVMGINPVNDTEIPIFISDYVLTSYGTGAIMAVPAHDTREDVYKRQLFEQYELTKHEAEALNIQIDDMSEAKRRLHEIKVAIKGLGSINVGAIEEYKEVSERYTFLKEQIGDVEKSKNELMKIIEDLTASMSEKFITQFNKINAEFKVCFADFFGGGKGELLLEQPDNCLESPIEIRIQPPGKSVQNINLFSGGEKSLAAMALLFSVLKVQPAPFCIYDEVEAALDDVNVERFAKYMRKMTDKTQFISITHRRGTMEEARCV